MATKASSQSAAEIAGRVLNGGRYSVADVKKLAASVLTQREKAKPPDDPEQYKRFLEAAKAAEASDDPKALDKAVGKLGIRATRDVRKEAGE